ncbi:patatin-like phospholipase family protein [Colwellia echini]|uniref:Serine protease n=1 Tax=Colwellia echini TaxID=1982103 RepID=A0ABY3MWB4_9GAMM|nr:patatin-like phospholipase family protein [Colwellia echini]TYK65394.1 serine protease [Colwellia echini]
MPLTDKKNISLVLGSGGARGLAHIGVIHWLEEHNYVISSISGCSIGALIGGIYAAGKLNEFERWIRAITKVDIVNLLDLSWQSSGLVKGDKIINTLTEIVGDIAIEDLPINFTAVAADIKNEKEVWINSGRLFDAIRASISLPLFFTPYNHNGIQLIDGGVLNPVPIAPTFGDSTYMTIAVNLGGPNIPTNDPQIKFKKKTIDSRFSTKIGEFIDSFNKSTQNNLNEKWGGYDIANQAFDAMQSSISRQKLAAYPPDILIEIARNACGTLEFDRADEMIHLGYSLCEEHFSRS